MKTDFLSFSSFIEKLQILPHYWLDKGIKGTVVNQALQSLHEGSLKTMLKVFSDIKIVSDFNSIVFTAGIEFT